MLRAVTLPTARYQTFRQLTPIPASHATADSLSRASFRTSSGLAKSPPARSISAVISRMSAFESSLCGRLVATATEPDDKIPCPPVRANFSRMTTRRAPASRAAIAAQSPAVPDPTTTTSQISWAKSSAMSSGSDESDASAPHAAAGAFARRPPRSAARTVRSRSRRRKMSGVMAVVFKIGQARSSSSAVTPASNANRMSSLWECTPSFAKAFARCILTVLTSSPNAIATSLFCFP